MEGTNSPRALADAVRAGYWLIGIAALHAAFGLWIGREPLLEIVRDGSWNTVDLTPGREVIFWFLVMSPWIAILGQLLIWAAQAGMLVPRAIGWWLLLLVLVCGVLLPASGFWLGLVPAALLLRDGTRARA